MKVRIYAPIKTYNGTSAGCVFVNGISETEVNTNQLNYFERHSDYIITMLEMPQSEPKKVIKKKGGKSANK